MGMGMVARGGQQGTCQMDASSVSCGTLSALLSSIAHSESSTYGCNPTSKQYESLQDQERLGKKREDKPAVQKAEHGLDQQALMVAIKHVKRSLQSLHALDERIGSG